MQKLKLNKSYFIENIVVRENSEVKFTKQLLTHFKVGQLTEALNKIEDKGNSQEKLSELTIKDLAQPSAMAQPTLKYRKERNAITGTENTNAKLIDTFLSEADGSVTFAYITDSTSLSADNQAKLTKNGKISGTQDYSTAKKRVNPLAPDKKPLLPNTEKKYEMQLKVLDFFEWLKVFEGEKITKKDLKDILEISNVQIWSTSPFYYWSGACYYASQVGASVVETDIPPKNWSKRDGYNSEYFLTKELYGLLRSMPFFLNPMVSQLNKKLKDRNLI